MRGGRMNVQEVVSPVLQAQRGVALSATQRSLWFQYLRYPELKGFFNIGFVVRIEPGLELDRLRAVLDELVRRHSMFRVSFASIDGEVIQQVRTDVSIPVQVIDVDARA